jgi:hypothetical protein
MNGVTIFISLSLSDDSWPFLIENDSSYAVAFCQTVGFTVTIRGWKAHFRTGCHPY